MMDTQTESRWSHILGKCVEGEFKGTTLESLPADIVTWSAWVREHPQSTVLNLSRTHREFTGEFYSRPERFVIGLIGRGMRHCSFVTLQQQPVLNITDRDLALLLTFDRDSTSARLFLRTVDERVLTFEPGTQGRLRDRETGSEWTRAGEAVAGPLQGKRLEPRVGIVSFTTAWRTFHPDSREIQSDGSIAP